MSVRIRSLSSILGDEATRPFAQPMLEFFPRDEHEKAPWDQSFQGAQIERATR
jgi:hypothetical protein